MHLLQERGGYFYKKQHCATDECLEANERHDMLGSLPVQASLKWVFREMVVKNEKEKPADDFHHNELEHCTASHNLIQLSSSQLLQLTPIQVEETIMLEKYTAIDRTEQ